MGVRRASIASRPAQREGAARAGPGYEGTPIFSRLFRRGDRPYGRGPLDVEASPFRTATPADRGLVLLDVVGLVATAVGLWLLSGTVVAGFDFGRAMAGVSLTLPETFPAAVSVFLGTAMNLAAGAVVVRVIRPAPYTSLSHLAVSGLAGAVLLDTLLLLSLGPLGLFRPLPLAIVNLLLIGLGVTVRPWFAADVGPRQTPGGVPVGWLLIAVVWAGPLVVVLASVVVPVATVLPNDVAPVAHLLSFGHWDQLAVNPSALYGQSQVWLGFVALLGSVDVLTGRPAPLAAAAFALPTAVLVAAGATLLCSTLVRDRTDVRTSSSDRLGAARRTEGRWALLTIPLTFVFVLIPSARPAAVVIPLVCLALATFGEGAREREGVGPQLRTASAARRSMLLALSLGAAFLVHPLSGLILAITILVCGLLAPDRLRLCLSGIFGGAVMAAPQLAIAFGVNGSPWLGLPFLALGLFAAASAGTVAGGAMPSALRPPSRDVGLPVMIGLLVIAGAALGVAAYLLAVSPDWREGLLAAVRTAGAEHYALLLPLLLLVLVRSAETWRVLGAALAVGSLVLLVAALLPGNTLQVAAWRQDVPVTAGTWLPWFAAIGAALGLAALWERRSWPPLVRVGLPVAFVVLASVAVYPEEVEPQRLTERPYAASLALDLHLADHGAWVGYPDAHRLLDAPRSALVARVQEEIDAGRLTAATTLLHVAPSFQPWVATPITAWTGHLETLAAPDARVDEHTFGGRLNDLAQLPSLLTQGFGYVVVEGAPPPADVLSMVSAAGYRVIWSNEVASLLAR